LLFIRGIVYNQDAFFEVYDETEEEVRKIEKRVFQNSVNADHLSALFPCAVRGQQQF